MNTKLFNTLLIILSLSIIACLLSVALTDLTPKETTLLGIVLTILSFIASWVVSKYFADRSHKQAIEEVKEQHLSNLRTYALNAAEKVNNLSNELAKLSVYLQQELEDDDEDLNTEELYLSSYERIESAIHIINTLKSVNDTYLSDWKGVIGEELDEKMEEQQARENDLKQLVERVESVIKAKPIEQNQNLHDVQNLSKQITDLRKDLNITLNSVSGTFVRTSRTPARARKEDVKKHCPKCNVSVVYKQRPSQTSFKYISCKNCSSKLSATWNELDGFKLEPEIKKQEIYNCPTCKLEIKCELSNFLNSRTQNICNNCKESSQIIRTIKGYTIHNIPKVSFVQKNDTGEKQTPPDRIEIDETILEKVREILPQQPWPKGTHKEVAEKLGLAASVVSRYIYELIRKGVFKPQVDGVLYEPIKKEVP
ncbi:hypothetical protein WG954_16365 [Lacibacter sp. H375]|uniref:hypothetical protein n=1 Tax=Lacibacter sp. H375 TaxID=3133424 RepID=UPI0030C01CB7